MRCLVLVCSFLLLFSSPAAAGWLGKKADEKPELRVRANLEFVNAGSEIRELPLSGAYLQKERDLLKKECGWERPVEEGAAVELIAMVVKPLLKLIVGGIDKALQEEVARYNAAYESSASAQFYASGMAPSLLYPCFQISRVVAKDSDPSVRRRTTALLGRFEIADGEALYIRPLRLYFAIPPYDSDEAKLVTKTTGVYGLAFSARANAVWRENNEGKRSSKVLDVKNLLAQKVKVEAAEEQPDGWRIFYKQYKKVRSPPQPLPSRSMAAGKLGGSHLELTVGVAEVGKPSWLVKNFAKLFHDKNDEIVELLGRAADEALKNSDENK